MPIDYSNYPDNWFEIREQILERAGHKCEWCGVDNHSQIIRNPSNKAEYVQLLGDGFEFKLPSGTVVDAEAFVYTATEAQAWIIDGWQEHKDIKVVLTIAHVHDHNPMNVEPDNLAALCQRCHIKHDAPVKAAKRKRRRRAEYEAETGQLTLFEEVKR